MAGFPGGLGPLAELTTCSWESQSFGIPVLQQKCQQVECLFVFVHYLVSSGCGYVPDSWPWFKHGREFKMCC